MCRAWYSPLIVVAVLLLAGILFIPTGPMAVVDLPTPTPWPTPTPGPVRVHCLTCEWTQEIRSLEARIERECVDTPERAANRYVCSGMRQVISLRRSSLGGTRAGVPVYIFRLDGGPLHTEVTLPEVERYLKQPLNNIPMWREVKRQILAYERSKQ